MPRARPEKKQKVNPLKKTVAKGGKIEKKPHVYAARKASKPEKESLILKMETIDEFYEKCTDYPEKRGHFARERRGTLIVVCDILK